MQIKELEYVLKRENSNDEQQAENFKKHNLIKNNSG